MTVIVKIGGSLYDLPDLGPRLGAWLATQSGKVIIVPGGGPMVETLRHLDRRHHLGEEACHWLALRILTVNAYFLAELLPGAVVVHDPSFRVAERVAIMDMYQFAQADESNPGRLPHSWDVSSDSLALRLAIVAHADRLVLLKSVAGPADLRRDGSWSEVVDRQFEHTLRQAPADLEVAIVNLRTWP